VVRDNSTFRFDLPSALAPVIASRRGTVWESLLHPEGLANMGLMTDLVLRTRSASRLLVALLRAIPFSISMVAVIFATSAITNCHFRLLFRYKGKFQPNWESIYLAHRGLTTLPAVAAALARAYLPHLSLAEATKFLGDSASRWLFPMSESTD
jgi:hypothetical protein